MTTNINHLKNNANVQDRDEKEVIDELPAEYNVKQDPVKIAKLKNKEKEALLGKIDRSEDQIVRWARETHT